MGKIWFTSDLHLFHDRQFVWGPRGFNSIYEMNEAIVKNWNEVVQPEDDVYVLGDLMLNNNEAALSLIKQLKGQIHVVRGNHDTDTRMELYNNCYNIVEITEGQFLNIKGYHFYLNHFPTFTSNLEKGADLKVHLINLFGHTHQKEKFYNQIPFMYNVALDAHDNKLVSFEEIIEDIQAEAKKCLDML